jgi:hypothetical protein
MKALENAQMKKGGAELPPDKDRPTLRLSFGIGASTIMARSQQLQS